MPKHEEEHTNGQPPDRHSPHWAIPLPHPLTKGDWRNAEGAQTTSNFAEWPLKATSWTESIPSDVRHIMHVILSSDRAPHVVMTVTAAFPCETCEECVAPVPMPMPMPILMPMPMPLHLLMPVPVPVPVPIPMPMLHFFKFKKNTSECSILVS